MVLSCQNISKSFGDKKILENISFNIDDTEKVAIIGINGAGKSTLLKIIAREYDADEGVVAVTKGKRIGYLSQDSFVDSDKTIYDELLSIKKDVIDLEHALRACEEEMKHAEGAELQKLMDRYTNLTHQFEQNDGYTYVSSIKGTLYGLGFDDEDFNRPIGTLSGGQKTRVALARLLLIKPDLIILDEPTNHLDIKSVDHLVNYLISFNGATLIVSHDRFFLDQITNKVIEIENGKAISFSGNYTEYSKKKKQMRQAQMNAYLNNQREIEHQKEVIDKLKQFNREKSIKRAESREKVLEKMDKVEKPEELNADMRLTLTPRVMSGNDVLTIKELSKSYDDDVLFSDVDIEIKRGEHVAIIGANGTGKTTLLKIIRGIESYNSGDVKLGSKVEIGYYDQEHQILHSEKTLFEEISDEHPELNNTEIRNTLAAFLFTGDDVFKRIGDLSGGERGRVSLAKLMLSNANFLILDEPTNHLDITSKEILEDALEAYEGTLLYVSHDRYFINRTAQKILELSGKKFTEYLGNYDYYLQKRAENIIVNDNTGRSAIATEDNQGKLDWKEMKKQAGKKKKRERELEKCEARIAEVEEKIEELEREMADPAIASNVAKLQELFKEQSAYNEELVELYEKWEEYAQ